jgi:Recombinase
VARAADLAPVIVEIRAAGAASLRAIANALNMRRIAAPRGGTWAAAQVRDLLRRNGIPVFDRSVVENQVELLTEEAETNCL